MTLVLRLCGVVIAFAGVLLIAMSIDARLTETGEPFAPGWIAAGSILGFITVVLGIVMVVTGGDE